MEITITQEKPYLHVMHLNGKLDGSNYKTLIDAARKLYDAGSRDVILDLSQLSYISSAGISALHRVALLFRGQKQEAEEEEGWASYRAIANEVNGNAQRHVKLFGPVEGVKQSLAMVGFNNLFETYTDMNLAIASFQ